MTRTRERHARWRSMLHLQEDPLEWLTMHVGTLYEQIDRLTRELATIKRWKTQCAKVKKRESTPSGRTSATKLTS